MAVFVPVMQRDRLGESGVEVRLGHDLVDAYLRFVAARCRPNTVLAAGFDLLVFFSFAGIGPVDVTAGDVLGFVADQRRPRSGNVVRLADGEGGLSARTVQHRLATLSGLFGYLVATGEMDASPMPSGLTSRGRASRSTGRGRGRERSAHPDTGDAAEAAGRAAPMRGARPSAGRRPRRRPPAPHHRGQGRP